MQSTLSPRATATAAPAACAARRSSGRAGARVPVASRAAFGRRDAPAGPRQRAFVETTRARGDVRAKLFTGLVQGTCEVSAIDAREDFRTLTLSFPPGALDGVSLGASVAINGTCLTLTSLLDAAGETLSSESHLATFDVIGETLARTNLGLLREGSRANYERSARVGDEIGGHRVSGHVHTIAVIQRVEETDDNRRVLFTLRDREWIKYVLPKGFVSVDGCSLTVGEVDPASASFAVYLIPETLRTTVLGDKGRGDYVNIEVDPSTQALVDAVERTLPEILMRMAGAQEAEGQQQP